ncbi:secretory lipase-domain-containing protein [Scheffersomyces coipomensis]|uniref:secretory lipase-domain-containing protein n=1 Tax=Scheffersomyces coipomensis TaxID=1788519 RepID=UPI00315DEBD3
MKNVFRSLITLVLLLSSIAIAAPTTLLAPSNDPFYSPPEGYESAAVGTILKSRVTPQPVRSVYVTVNVKNAWQLLVRSEDSFGNATAIVTTIIEPHNADPSKLLSYQFFEDAANLSCSISYALQFNAPVLPVIQTEFEMYFLEAALEQGWYVVAPDYEGPKSAFTAGRQAGHAVLDSIRATLQSNSISGVNSDAKVALWGYSGGSLASGWAAALQPAYAPELSTNLIGAAVGGFVTNITATAVAVDGGPFTGLVPLAVNGLMNEYPEVAPIVQAQMSASNYQSFLQGSQLCMIPGALSFIGKTFFTGANKYFNDGLAFFQNPTVASIVEQNTLAVNPDAEVPQIPLFIYQGVIDAVVPAVGAERAYKNWCAWGSPSIELALDSTNGHVTETFIGAPAALTWLIDRFEGKAPVQGCTSTTRVSNLEYPGTPASLVIYFQTALASIIQLPIGPLIQFLPTL